MKKLQFVLIALITATLFISCQNSKGVSKAEDMGKYAFDFLKNLDETTKDGYITTLFTIEEIKAFGERNAETLDPKAKEGIDRIEVQNHKERIGKDYNRLKERGKKHEISWDAIEYDSYDFEEKDKDGIKFVRGKLSFKHKDENYILAISSVLIDGSYMLIRINGLTKKDL